MTEKFSKKALQTGGNVQPPIQEFLENAVIVSTTRGVRKGAPGPSDILNNENKCIFYKRTIKVCVVLDTVLGPSHLARHTWLCPLFSVVLEATHKASQGLLKGAVSAQKDLKCLDGDEGVAGRNARETSYPMKGH